MEIDSLTIPTGEGNAVSYIIVDRESGYCWNWAVCETDDVAEVVEMLGTAVAKIRSAASPAQIIELRHDGADAFTSDTFVQAVEQFGLSKAWASDGLPVDIAERALWELRTRFNELAD